MKRIFKRIIIGIIVIVALAIFYLMVGKARPVQDVSWGLSFSQLQAESLGLDWKIVYTSALDELGVTHLRIPTYWDRIEKTDDGWDFSEVDFMVQQALAKDRSIILAVGRRQPRWPECHIPEWAVSLEADIQDEEVLEFLEETVSRYKNYPNIVSWQVENEFFLDSFGDCPDYDKSLLDREIELVRALDDRPIVVTDSGELSSWYQAGKRADILGVSMYRTVRDSRFGYVTYPHRPVYYWRQGKLMRWLTGFDRLIVSELQMEPWSVISLKADSTEENYRSFGPDDFGKNLQYARNAGIDEAYLWGVEWWYYMKTVRNISDFWQQAETLWTDEN